MVFTAEASRDTLHTKFLKKNGGIRRPRNSFMCFAASEHRSNLTEANPDLHQSAICKLLGESWNKLSSDKRRQYEEQAECEKQQHALLFPTYKYTPLKKSEKIKKTLMKAKARKESREAKPQILRQALLKGKIQEKKGHNFTDQLDYPDNHPHTLTSSNMNHQPHPYFSPYAKQSDEDKEWKNLHIYMELKIHNLNFPSHYCVLDYPEIDDSDDYFKSILAQFDTDAQPSMDMMSIDFEDSILFPDDDTPSKFCGMIFDSLHATFSFPLFDYLYPSIDIDTHNSFISDPFSGPDVFDEAAS